MNRSHTFLSVITAVIIATLLAGCAVGTQLLTKTAEPKSIQGTYDLITYGCRYPDDVERAAFLISPEKTGRVELFVPATSYQIKRGIPAEQALAEANVHVRCGVRTVESTRVHSIPDGSGGTLGYEVLPRFPSTDETGMDPLDVTYTLKQDGKIVIYIKLFPDVERKLYRSSPGAGM